MARTILVHLSIDIDDEADLRTADQIADEIGGALDVGTEGAISAANIALAEEV